MKVCILPALALAGLAVLSGCTSDSGNPAQPSFYASMADASGMPAHLARILASFRFRLRVMDAPLKCLLFGKSRG